MSINKKSNITLALILLGYGLMFLIIVLGAIFPGDPAPNGLPWFVWATIGEMIAMAVATITIFVIVQKKNKQLKEHQDNE